MPPSVPEVDQIPAQPKPTATEEEGMHYEVETSSSTMKSKTTERDEVCKRLFVQVGEELARGQAKAAAATVPAVESYLPMCEIFVPSSPLPPLPLLQYTECYDPLLDRTDQFSMNCGFYPEVASILIQHIVSTVYRAEFASGVGTVGDRRRLHVRRVLGPRGLLV